MTILEPLLADVPDLRWLLDVPEEELEVIWDELNPDERYALGAFLLGAPTGNKVDWQPLPHQIPPPPGWFLWMLTGGRGIGKTDAGAHYMDQHAMGPPCLVGEMPHRMAIVAPTLGDASEACVNGPSGLRAHNPTTTMTTRRGGSFVNWPNGSEARLLGAYSPQDVERLRAAGNRSLRAGTLIATEFGQHPIETIIAGERVWTSHGLRTVVSTQDHGVKPMWRMTTAAGRKLEMTADHEVWTDRGWIRCDGLRPGDRLTAWNGTVTAGSALAHTGHDLCSTEMPTASGVTGRFSCTEPSMRTTTARYLTGSTSTTATATRATTDPTISWHSHRVFITPSIPRHGNGMWRAGGFPETASNRHAASVGSSALGRTGPTARRRAGAKRNDEAGLRCGHALCAATSSLPTSETDTVVGSLVVDRVATCSPGNVDAPVFDLTVAGDHEFIANGVLVANCLVWLEELCAWRYLRDCWDHIRLGLLREGPHPHAIATTTPKNRPTYKRLLTDKRTVVTSATTMQNPHLPTMIREALYDTYGGTRLGLQELEGQVLEDVEGALWTQELIETRMRTATVPGSYERVVVAVDPSWGTTNDECGIIGAGRANKTGYVLADESGRMAPADWGRRAAELYTRLRADRLLGEGNFQGEQVKLVAKTVNDDETYEGDHVMFHLVYASRGKRLRAEPVLALCEQGRIKLVGRHILLEHQLCTWVPPERNDRGDAGDPEDFEPTSDVASSDVALPSEFSPDRLDAFVFAMTDLLLGRDGPARIGIARGQLPDALGLAGRVGGMRPLGR